MYLLLKTFVLQIVSHICHICTSTWATHRREVIIKLKNLWGLMVKIKDFTLKIKEFATASKYGVWTRAPRPPIHQTPISYSLYQYVVTQPTLYCNLHFVYSSDCTAQYEYSFSIKLSVIQKILPCIRVHSNYPASCA